MKKPNWFDKAFAESMEKMTAEQALAVVAKTPRVIKRVDKAIKEHDKNVATGSWAGPSRTQVIRAAIAEVIEADED